jgi:hypothetical protein
MFLDQNREVRWTIDPVRGWNPTRSELRVDGKVVRSCECELKDGSGGWFPSAIRYADSDGKVYVDVCVSDALLNGPDQPSHLSPYDVGIDDGVMVYTMDGPQDRVQFFGNGRVMDDTEFKALLRAGTVTWGPAITRLRAKVEGQDSDEATRASAGGLSDRKRFLGLWEKYVRDFIAKYALDDAQSRVALSKLHMCQSMARAYVARRRAAYDAVEKRIDAAGTDPGKLKIARDDLIALGNPIHDIFDKQLVPRLERIPTRSQRETVEKKFDKASTEMSK